MNVNEEPDVSHAWGMSGVNGFPGSYIKHVLRILLVYPDSTDSRTLLLNSKNFLLLIKRKPKIIQILGKGKKGVVSSIKPNLSNIRNKNDKTLKKYIYIKKKEKSN